MGTKRPEIDKFIGAIHGEFEQGVLFTTSDFTTCATEVSLKKGVVKRKVISLIER